jgi:hypothetical protein
MVLLRCAFCVTNGFSEPTDGEQHCRAHLDRSEDLPVQCDPYVRRRAGHSGILSRLYGRRGEACYSTNVPVPKLSDVDDAYQQSLSKAGRRAKLEPR